MSDSENPLTEGLILEADQVLVWHTIPELPNDVYLAQANETNEWFLRACLSYVETSDREEPGEYDLELRRLDLKLNLLMDMVGLLLRQQLQPNNRRPYKSDPRQGPRPSLPPPP